MTATHDFSRLLKPVVGDTAPSGPGQLMLTVDTVAHQVVEHTLWQKLRSNRYKRFIVYTAHDVDAYAEETGLQVELGDYEGEAGLHVSIDYRARCQPGDERIMVEALAGKKDVRELVHERLRFWVEEFAQKHAGVFIDNYREHEDGLRRQIKDLALRQLGLTLKVKLKLVGQDRLRPVEIGPKEIAVRLCDHKGKVNVRCGVTLPVQEQLLSKAVQRQPQLDRLDGQVIDAITSFFEARVSLHQFYREMESSVMGALRERLEELARSWGREVGHLEIESAGPPNDTPDTYESKHEFERELAEYPEPVKIRTGFMLVLRDVGRYVAAGSPLLETWARKNIEESARQVLFTTRYTELVRSVDAKKAEMKSRMADWARAIGYDIQQFIAITNLPVDQLREPFTVVAKENFSTHVPEVLAGLEVRATARIPEITRIEGYLDRREDVISAMAAVMRDHVAEILHDVDPEEFYLYFDTPLPHRKAQARKMPTRSGAPHQNDESDSVAQVVDAPEKAGETLERRLRNSVARVLRDRFGAEVSHVVFKESDDAITALLRDLRRRSRDFEVIVEPKGGTHLPAVFELVVSVNAVDPKGWQNFLTKRPDMDVIVKTIQTALTGRLSEVEPDELYNLRGDQMIPFLNDWAAERIGREFGLNVHVSDLRRRHTEQELANAALLIEVTRARLEANRAEIAQQSGIRNIQLQLETTRLQAIADEFESNQRRLQSASDLDDIERQTLSDRNKVIMDEMKKAHLSDGEDGFTGVLVRRGISAVDNVPRPPASRRLGQPNLISLLNKASDEAKE